jgi:hypothetical protein
MDQDDLNALRTAARALRCPFEARMNPHVERAHAASRAWGRATRLLPDVAALHGFDAARFAWLTARAYPTAPLPELVLVAQWNLWLFVHDDGCDAAPAGRDPRTLTDRYRELGSILHGAPASATTNASGRALGDLLPRLFARARPGWRERFVALVDDYFAACVWEAGNRSRNVVPSVDEYVEKRRDTGAVRTAIANIELCERIHLADEVLAHPHVDALATACNDVVCWSNDIISLAKERETGDMHNLVSVLERACCPGDLARATELAAGMHDARVDDFVGLAATLPSFDPNTDAALSRFVDTLRAWMRGNLDWAYESGRYLVAAAS